MPPAKNKLVQAFLLMPFRASIACDFVISNRFFCSKAMYVTLTSGPALTLTSGHMHSLKM